MDKKYGQKEIESFDIEKDLELWDNKHNKTYAIKISLPEFTCLCPRSGYPDFAVINIEYAPQDKVVELKALKLYINSFRDKSISHEDSINIIYDVLYDKLQPRYLKIEGNFNPRGNVSTTIEIDSRKA
jgi:7-cyano-7-deazaguanine reductase